MSPARLSAAVLGSRVLAALFLAALVLAVPLPGTAAAQAAGDSESAAGRSEAGGDEGALIKDPSFENTKPRDRWGLVFEDWGGWKYEGECEFRVGDVAHSGEHSCLLFGANAPKIRVRATERELEPGRYRITAWLRGLDIGTGQWDQTTEFMFDEDYFRLEKNGTFGWTPVTYVAQIEERREVTGPSFGLMAPGYFWIDDVQMEKVGDDVELTEKPVLGEEESPIEPPGPLAGEIVHCPECGYRSRPEWATCWACGASLAAAGRELSGPSTKLITSFEEGSPFGEGEVVERHATDGEKALRLDSGYTSMDAGQDWTGFDYLKADVHTDADRAVDLYIEVRDTETRGYWTRVNYNTIVPPGSSTVVMPTNIYVGEKSRPGRKLLKSAVTRLVFSIGENPPAPLYIDNVRLERDESARRASFEGLHAYDFGTAESPLMEGFTRVTPATKYTPGRGYGLQEADIRRAYDALQPEPLYEDFICIRSGGFAVDLPDGEYHVFLNIDNPSGYWGEYQVYRQRSVLAEGRRVVHDTMDFESFQEKYYRFWDDEDLPSEDTFEKYQTAYYEEKEFDVTVADGTLNLDFRGANWAVSLSALVIYPAEKAAGGERFLEFAREKRRFHFENYFHRILHKGSGEGFAATGEERERGLVLFSRDVMSDVYYNDRPEAGERVSNLSAFAFAGEKEPLSFSVYPLEDLGEATVSVSDLVSSAGTIPSRAVEAGWVAYRLSRRTMEGTVYTIAPRQVIPDPSVDMPAELTRRFWLTVSVPEDSAPGVYEGEVRLETASGASAALPLSFEVMPGSLDPLDVPAGPWGHTINTQWPGEEAARWNDVMARKSLDKLRESGFTSFSGMPVVNYRGFRGGEPVLDLSTADRQMERAREAGFDMPVVNYCPFRGLNLYYRDEQAMRDAGFEDYSRFVKALFSAVRRHAEEEDWLPVYWNLGDEPVGDDLGRSIENARAYTDAFPEGPPYFTAATSFTGGDTSDPHYRLATALHVANVNGHDAASINAIHEAGGDWAFYNGGNRWTFGTYMYKAVKEYDLKFRLTWHWNVVAGDPYYALDCREDDYAWCNSTPDARLVPSLDFLRIREGVDDYRMLRTLDRLAGENEGSAEAAAARGLIDERLAAFEMGQRSHDAIFPHADWFTFRRRLAESIAALR